MSGFFFNNTSAAAVPPQHAPAPAFDSSNVWAARAHAWAQQQQRTNAQDFGDNWRQPPAAPGQPYYGQPSQPSYYPPTSTAEMPMPLNQWAPPPPQAQYPQHPAGPGPGPAPIPSLMASQMDYYGPPGNGMPPVHARPYIHPPRGAMIDPGFAMRPPMGPVASVPPSPLFPAASGHPVPQDPPPPPPPPLFLNEDDADSASSAADHKKSLPAWIQQDLERIEREKKANEEREQRKRRLEAARKAKGSGHSSDTDGRSGSDEEVERPRKFAERVYGYLTPEEREEVVTVAMKELVKTLLLRVTTPIIEQKTQEVALFASKKETKKVVVNKNNPALAALAQLGGSSDSESEDEDVPETSSRPAPTPFVNGRKEHAGDDRSAERRLGRINGSGVPTNKDGNHFTEMKRSRSRSRSPLHNDHERRLSGDGRSNHRRRSSPLNESRWR